MMHHNEKWFLRRDNATGVFIVASQFVWMERHSILSHWKYSLLWVRVKMFICSIQHLEFLIRKRTETKFFSCDLQQLLFVEPFTKVRRRKNFLNYERKLLLSRFVNKKDCTPKFFHFYLKFSWNNHSSDRIFHRYA